MQDLSQFKVKHIFVQPNSHGRPFLQRLTPTGYWGLGMVSIGVVLAWARQRGAHAAADWDINKDRPERKLVKQGPMHYHDLPPKSGV